VTENFDFNHYRIIGLCNNFAYVVMLSAAQDILSKTPANETVEDPCPVVCKHFSTYWAIKMCLPI
jgi:hypothetical protein